MEGEVVNKKDGLVRRTGQERVGQDSTGQDGTGGSDRDRTRSDRKWQERMSIGRDRTGWDG